MTVILVGIVVLFAIFSEIMVIKAVKVGFHLIDSEQTSDEEVFHLPKKKKEPKMSADEYRTTQILANIDRYNGSGEGQVKVVARGK